MESLDTATVPSMDDLLDFSLDLDENDYVDHHHHHHRRHKAKPLSIDPDNHFLSLPEWQEEELEWISNKDAFPGIETSLDMLSDHAPVTGLLKQHSPVSVLDSITTTNTRSSNSGSITSSESSCGIKVNFGRVVKTPRKARTPCQRRARGDLLCWSAMDISKKRSSNAKLAGVVVPRVSMGRKCQHCGVEKTPQWRAGPLGAKTLCNACGVRYKSGRLVPEYRPANSPTFSSELHSNSHRKVVEMRRQKQMMGLLVEKSTEKG